jgi:hypothetical protein
VPIVMAPPTRTKPRMMPMNVVMSIA